MSVQTCHCEIAQVICENGLITRPCHMSMRRTLGHGPAREARRRTLMIPYYHMIGACAIYGTVIYCYTGPVSQYIVRRKRSVQVPRGPTSMRSEQSGAKAMKDRMIVSLLLRTPSWEAVVAAP
eukprot:767040-Hanusia_phi.AAC.3